MAQHQEGGHPQQILKYFAQFEQLTAAVEKTLADFAAAPQQGLGLLGRYCEETGLMPQPLKLAA